VPLRDTSNTRGPGLAGSVKRLANKARDFNWVPLGPGSPVHRRAAVGLQRAELKIRWGYSAECAVDVMTAAVPCAVPLMVR